jgi:GntR family transcriptional repressor for pyruvate dehydrogenase complex
MVLQGEQVHLRDLAEAILQMEPTCASACAARAECREVLYPLVEENLATAKDAIGDGPAFTHASRQFHDLVVAHMTPVTTRLVIRSLVATWSVQEQTWAYEASQVGRYPTADDQRVALIAGLQPRYSKVTLRARNVTPARISGPCSNWCSTNSATGSSMRHRHAPWGLFAT